MRSLRAIIAAVCVLAISGCLRSQEPLNPPMLVTARDTDVSIQLFMQATILLARYYGFNTIRYSELRDKSVRQGYAVIPFMPPISNNATPPFDQRTIKPFPEYDQSGHKMSGADYDWWVTKFVAQNGSDPQTIRRALIKNYVTTGLRASQLICRNYMIGLDEKNRYLEFLQKEFNIGAGLANAFFILANANVTAMSVLHGLTVGTNLATDAFQEYRFLAIDRDVAVALIDTAQNRIASDFLTSKDFASATFADAVQIISSIEYQCTRSGIRNLITNAAKDKTDSLAKPAKDDGSGGAGTPGAGSKSGRAPKPTATVTSKTGVATTTLQPR